jgi:hypothetical protein
MEASMREVRRRWIPPNEDLYSNAELTKTGIPENSWGPIFDEATHHAPIEFNTNPCCERNSTF